MDKKDSQYMRRALYLATLGKGNVSPNPLVGSVIVYDGKIIGEGYHQKYGEAHAEVNAIQSVKDKSLLKNATIYVNLEPCAHFGKTPPCSNLIIEHQIPRVVIGCIDSYSEVAGKGIKKMRDTGIEVMVGILEQESLELNKRFFCFHTNKRPYIILKWAQSANGFMDIERGVRQAHPTVKQMAHATGKQKVHPTNGSINQQVDFTHKGIFWITQPETKTLVHKWRAEEAGILVGRQTIENDNPSLTCRDYKGHNPTRFVIDKDLKTNYSNFTLSKDGVTTYIFNQIENKSIDNIHFIKLSEFTLTAILHELYKLNIQSIIIEGGKFTLDQFIENNLWDEAKILTGVGNIEDGIKAPLLHGKKVDSFYFGKDLVEFFSRENKKISMG